MPNYYLFVVVSIILIVTPGPDFALITKNTILHEKRGGHATTYGVITGHILHATASVLGISAVIAKSIVLFEIVKYAGAVYLLYIGIKALLSKQKNDSENQDYTNTVAQYQNSKKKSCFIQGLLSTTFNPKAIIFYITFLPQVIEPHSNVLLQSFVFSGIFILIALFWLLLCVSILNHIRSWFRKPSVQLILERLTGITLISLGIKLAFEKR